MDKFRGGLLSSSATAALGLGMFVDPALCSIDGEGDDTGGGGGGGDAGSVDDLLDEPAPAAAEGGNDDGNDGEVVDGLDAGDPELLDWMKGFSGDKADGADSNQEFLAKKRFKDPDAMVKSYRAAETALRESGRVKIPGADAKPEEVAAFREAMGVPDKAEGYEIKLPEGLDGEKFEVDGSLLNPLREVALANNIPAKSFGAIADAFMRSQAEAAIAEADANNVAKSAKLKEWGAEATVKKEEFKRGAQLLQLDKAKIQRIQAGYGVGETMDMLANIGRMAGEDFFAGGQAAERFGVADLASAEKALSALIDNPSDAKKIRDGTDPALKAKYNRAVKAVAHFRELENKKV